MKLLKKSSHADTMPRVEIKFNINVQFIVHKLVYGFVLILWLIVSHGRHNLTKKGREFSRPSCVDNLYL